MVSKKGYYFIKVILFLAFSKKGSFSIKELSERLAISEKLHPANVKRFSVAIETINRLGSQAVVVRQDSEKESRL